MLNVRFPPGTSFELEQISALHYSRKNHSDTAINWFNIKFMKWKWPGGIDAPTSVICSPSLSCETGLPRAHWVPPF